MRLIQVAVPEEQRDAMERVLDENDIERVQTETADEDGRNLYQFPLQPEAVDEILDALEEAGLDREEYTVVASAEAAWPEQPGDTDHEDRISPEELRSRAVGMSPGVVTYYGMTVLSAVVATAGLLLDSPAIVVGSMVIAPQVGAALTSSVGTALNDRELIRTGFRNQIAGLFVAVVAAAAFGALFRFGQFVPSPLDVTTIQQIGQRISPGLMSMTVGVCAGAAGAVGLATALPVSLVGVMIAAALIPAAAAIGIGIAWGFPAVALGASVLLLVNAASINIVGFAVLWALGFRPEEWEERESLSARLRVSSSTVVVVVLLLGAFTLASGVTASQMEVATEVNEAVGETLGQPEYEELELLSVRTRFSGVTPLDVQRRVHVTVARPADEPYPELAATVARQVESRLDTNVSVIVDFEERQRIDTSGAGSPSLAGRRAL